MSRENKSICRATTYIERFKTVPTEDMFTVNTHDLSTASYPFQGKATSWTAFNIGI